MRECRRTGGLYVSPNRTLFIYVYGCGKWTCNGECKMRKVEDRLGVIKNCELPRHLYFGTLENKHRHAVYQQVRRKKVNSALVSWGHVDMFTVLADAELAGRAWTTYEFDADVALELFESTLTSSDMLIRQYRSHGKWRYVPPTPVHTKVNHSASPIKLREALEMAGFKEGQRIVDFEELEQRYAEAQRKVGYTDDGDEDLEWEGTTNSVTSRQEQTG